MKLGRAWVVVSALSMACGSRTGLEEPATTTTQAPQNGCTSDLLAGAPTPMRNYCSTRANLAPAPAPAAPEVTHTVSLGKKHVTYPTELVVDADGRVYVALDAKTETAVTPKTITAVDPSGEIAWKKHFEGAVGGLFLRHDGKLAARYYDGQSSLIVLDRNGHQASSVALPEHQLGGFAIGSDGSLFTVIARANESDRVVKLAPDGSVIWTSPVVSHDCGICSSSVALSADDRAFIATAWSTDGEAYVTHLVAIASDGSIAWDRSVEGVYSQGPAVASDGSLRLAVAARQPPNPDFTAMVYSFSANGDLIWALGTDHDPQQTWDNPLVIGVDGTTLVHAFAGIDAISASGALIWHRAATTNLYYDAFVDPFGTLVVALDGRVRALELSTGAERWSMSPDYYPSAFALAPRGGLAVLRGESLVLMRDP